MGILKSTGDQIATNHSSLKQLRQEIVGIDRKVPLIDGSWQTYVNLDNAASTPALQRVKDKVSEALEYYSSVHRGSGFKSLFSTHLYERSREIVAEFVGADLQTETVIFVKNTTEAINKLANRMTFAPDDIVLTSEMEHHSNDLPWRAKAQVLYASLLPDGELDVDDLLHKLEENAGKVKLVAITGASNVTGFTPPIYEIAEAAHRYGAMILVDCAQLLPHRPVNMGPADAPRHLDFIAISAHKIYAPFGTGALIGPKAFFNQGDPDYRGGGTVEIVTLSEVVWTEAPERDEAGSPNVLGAVALAASLSRLKEIGMDTIAAHEAELTRYALEQLNQIPGVQLYGSTDPQRTADRVGVIPLEVQDMPHALLSAILSFEGAIGVRNGCFCAHPYVLHLKQVTEEQYWQYHKQVLQHDRSYLPGFIRASFGCYNNFEDIDRLAGMLKKAASGDYQGDYVVDPHSGSFYPRGFELQQMEEYFHF